MKARAPHLGDMAGIDAVESELGDGDRAPGRLNAVECRAVRSRVGELRGDPRCVDHEAALLPPIPDARDIVDELTARQIKLNLGGSIHDPTDPVGRLLFNVLAMVAEFEADLIRARTREGMEGCQGQGRLRGKQPKLSRRGKRTS